MNCNIQPYYSSHGRYKHPRSTRVSRPHKSLTINAGERPVPLWQTPDTLPASVFNIENFAENNHLLALNPSKFWSSLIGLVEIRSCQDILVVKGNIEQLRLLSCFNRLRTLAKYAFKLNLLTIRLIDHDNITFFQAKALDLIRREW